MKNLLADLNDKQREAVTAPLGPVLVFAGAGSGKTRVLAYRIAYLLQQKIFKPENLLALTFTNKAAGEMRERINRILNIEYRMSNQIPNSITMGTFHSVCARILRREIEKLGYSRNFVIYGRDDTDRLIKQVALELGVKEQFPPEVFGYYISAAKNRLVAPSELKLDNPYLEEILQKVYELYELRMREHNALDFDDLLKLVCELFRTHPKILQKYQTRFKYILVDEYQDTNHAQYIMLKLLVKKHRNIFVVGDDAQSIYGFRGANMQNILDFQKDYPKAQVVCLEQNYRSTQNILDAASKVIKLNPFQYEKKLWTKNLGGEKISIYEARDEMDEAEFVLRVIARRTKPDEAISSSNGIAASRQGGTRNDDNIYYVRGETPILDRFAARFRKGVPQFYIPNSTFQIPDNLSEIVILYRTHAQSRPFEEVLLPAGIPYQIVGGIKFYERKEIKDALAYLRLMQNRKDLVSLGRVINLPARGIGAANLRQVTLGLQKYHYNYHRLLLNLESLELYSKATAGAKDFLELLLRAERLPKSRSLLLLIRLLLERSGYKKNVLDGTREGEERWENIEELFNVAARYKNLPWPEGLEAFLEEVALMTDLDTMEDKGNKLTLMTLHSAKGLEFEKVFLVGLEEGLLPHSRSLLSPQELAEEIRLAYVGMTRAKKNLYLSYARQRQSYGELKQSVPSRVIKAIPKKLLYVIRHGSPSTLSLSPP